jgi:hypothetical protein
MKISLYAGMGLLRGCLTVVVVTIDADGFAGGFAVSGTDGFAGVRCPLMR